MKKLYKRRRRHLRIRIRRALRGRQDGCSLTEREIHQQRELEVCKSEFASTLMRAL